MGLWVNFLGILTLLLIALKLAGMTTLSWVWVFSPLWMPVALVLAMVFAFVSFILILAIVMSIIEARS